MNGWQIAATVVGGILALDLGLLALLFRATSLADAFADGVETGRVLEREGLDGIVTPNRHNRGHLRVV